MPVFCHILQSGLVAFCFWCTFILGSHSPVFPHFSHVGYPVILSSFLWFISSFVIKGWWDYHCLEYLIRHNLPEQSRLLILYCVLGEHEVQGLEDFWGRSQLISSREAWLLGWDCCWLVVTHRCFIAVTLSLICCWFSEARLTD